jgi:hypothetical protein
MHAARAVSIICCVPGVPSRLVSRRAVLCRAASCAVGGSSVLVFREKQRHHNVRSCLREQVFALPRQTQDTRRDAAKEHLAETCTQGMLG